MAPAFGLFPIGWIILNVIFLYQLTNEKGEFDVLQRSIRNISDDRRLQLLFIAFSFGAFFEGAAGFGTPVAVTAAMLIGLGFSPLAASGLSLIANTAPVAYGALGTPVIALAAVTGLDLFELSGMIGRQLPFFSLIVPFWLIWAFVGFRRMLEVWPALLVAASASPSRNTWSRTSMAHGWWTSSPRSSRWSASPCSCASGTRPGSWPRCRATGRPRTCDEEAHEHPTDLDFAGGRASRPGPLGHPQSCSCSSGASRR